VEDLPVKDGEKIEAGPNQENLEEICDIIFNMDKKIRFVEIVVKDKTFRKIRPGLSSNLSPEEIEESIDDSLARWRTREKLSPKLGKPVYAMAEYEKVKRITIPINHGGIILVTLDSTGFHEVIIKEIVEIKEMINWNL
jgi:hypothetical protein